MKLYFSNNDYTSDLIAFVMYKIPFPLVILVLNFISVALYAADINVSTDRNPVNLNESVQITFTANDQPDGEPDFSPFEKDFTILNQAQQQSTQIINWERKKSFQWILTLMPKHAGNLVIPAINFGTDNSQFSSIVVNTARTTSDNKGDLFLQVDVNNAQPYIQEQVIYTLKLYRKVNISQASLSEPVLQNAVIEKLGEDKNYNTQYQGENYVVTERKYAIFPQKSGVMTIAPLTLAADVIIANQRRSNGFLNRQSTRTKRVASEALTLEVKPKPVQANGQFWLPAKQVYLQEKWPDDAVQMVVGEPITRTISLFVEGITVGALPELYKNNMPAYLKAYPDQPVLKEEAKDSGMVALREEKIALIPGKAGSYTLPEIKVPWWNTGTQKMEVAVIAERTIIAVPAVDSNGNTQAPLSVISPLPLSVPEAENESVSLQENHDLWFWLTIFFACAWIATLIYFLSKKTKETKDIKPQIAKEKEVAILKMLKQACINNEPVMVKDVLLKWGRKEFKQSSLTNIAQQCDAALLDEIHSLNAILYSNNAEAWQGNALWLAFQSNQSTRAEKRETLDPLQPLFKI